MSKSAFLVKTLGCKGSTMSAFLSQCFYSGIQKWGEISYRQGVKGGIVHTNSFTVDSLSNCRGFFLINRSHILK